MIYYYDNFYQILLVIKSAKFGYITQATIRILYLWTHI